MADDKSKVAGHDRASDSDFQEGHKLDANMAKRVPKGMAGRCLSAKEAAQLLKRLAG